MDACNHYGIKMVYQWSNTGNLMNDLRSLDIVGIMCCHFVIALLYVARYDMLLLQ